MANFYPPWCLDTEGKGITALEKEDESKKCREVIQRFVQISRVTTGHLIVVTIK